MKQFIKNSDIFAAQPVLRVKGESQVTNLFGGICSIVVTIAFVLIFVASLISIFTYNDIKVSETVSNDRSDTEVIDVQIFAVGLFGFDMSSVAPYLSVVTYVNEFSMMMYPIRIEQIPMVPCTFDMWSDIENAEQQFKMYAIGTMMCPQYPEKLKMYGDFYTKAQKYITTSIQKCDNATSPVTCASPADVNSYYANTVAGNPYIAASVLTKSTNFNPTNKVATYKYVNIDSFWLTFSDVRGVQSIVWISTYQVKTDESFLPWNQIVSQKGTAVSKSIFSPFQRDATTTKYLQVYYILDSTNRIFQRQYGKIDDALSYVGGLFGIITSFLGFFMLSLNEYRYELAVAESAFSTRFQDDTKIGQNHMTFLKYLKYSFYDWVKVLTCGHQFQWKDCKLFDQAREEAVSQIDVKFLLRRINYLEHANNIKISKEQSLIMSLSENHSIEEVKKKRLVVEYMEKIMQGRTALTLQSIDLVQKVMENVGDSSQYLFGKIFQKTQMIKSEPKQNNPSIIEMNQMSSFQKINMQEQYSINIIDRILQQHEGYLKQFQQLVPQLTSEENEIEEQIATDFMKIGEEIRKKMMRKIPLPILYRISKRNNLLKKQKQERESSMNHFANLIKVREYKQ